MNLKPCERCTLKTEYWKSKVSKQCKYQKENFWYYKVINIKNDIRHPRVITERLLQTKKPNESYHIVPWKLHIEWYDK